jgi:hypothetical protein
MSIADHFVRDGDAGLVLSYDSRTARRQFQISLVLILILTAAAFALGLLVRSDEPAASAEPSMAHELDFAADLTAYQG